MPTAYDCLILYNIPMFEVFDRYEEFTDLNKLKEYSVLPLRKSVRVNTLKISVADFIERAKQKSWQLDPVLWCSEGFFIDREDRSEALGKDLLHLLGYIYMQEASSMLPVSLLDPQPGEKVLDLSAAPGSKTSQIAAVMKNTGVVVANDIQPKRLQTLKSALFRLGVINTIITQKQGQWFGVNMAERFDRVLCDAPCTAQGTVRKDPEAIKYCSEAGIKKAASLQKNLLESAIHAAKVGGRIVYSTCTLTPEENEAVLLSLLEKYQGKVEVVDVGNEKLMAAIRNSQLVQKSLVGNYPFSELNFPFLRLWPQTYNTGGFFCAVLKKMASTCDKIKSELEYFREKPLKRKEMEIVRNQTKTMYGTDFLNEGDWLFEKEGEFYLGREDLQDFRLPTVNYCLGLPYAKKLRNKTIRLHNDLVCSRGQMASVNQLDLSSDQLSDLLNGKDSSCLLHLDGDVILQSNGLNIGVGLAKEGKLKNNLPRWLIGHTAG